MAAAAPDPYGGARAAESGDRDLRKPPDTKRGKQKHTKQVIIIISLDSIQFKVVTYEVKGGWVVEGLRLGTDSKGFSLVAQRVIWESVASGPKPVHFRLPPAAPRRKRR